MPKTARRSSANYLQAWREHRGLTQEQLAERVDTTGSVISLLESGARGLSDKWLRRLAPALDTRPGYLLECDPNDTNVDMELLEAMLALPKDRKQEATEMLRVFTRRRP